MSRLTRLLPWIWAGVVALGTVAIFTIPQGAAADAVADAWIWVFFPLLFSVLAAVVFSRSPGNGVAWLLLFVGVGQIPNGAIELISYNARPLDPTPWDAFVFIWSNTAYFVTLILPLLVLLHIFPSGRVLNERWRWVWWVTVTMVVDLLIFGVFPAEIVDSGWTFANPIGIEGVSSYGEGLPAAILGVGMISLLVGGVVSIVLRYRRSSTTVRSQIKWVLLALIVFALVLGGTFLPFSFTDSDWYELAFPLSVAFVPVSIALAVTRYRLYDVDRFISRTITYAIVVGILVGSVALLATLVGTRFESPLAVAATTLGVAAAFSPLRRRIQEFVDRRFNRARYDRERLVNDFSSRLQGELEADTGRLRGELVETVVNALEPESIGIWVAAAASSDEP